MLMTLGDIVRLNAAAFPKKLALVSGAERLTYDDVNRRVNRIAHALLRAGIGFEDRVAVLGYNTIEYFCLYFATAKIGAILLPMNFWHRAEEHRHLLDNGEPKLLLRQARFAEAISDASAGLNITTIELPTAGENPAGEEEIDIEREGEAEDGGGEGDEHPAHKSTARFGRLHHVHRRHRRHATHTRRHHARWHSGWRARRAIARRRRIAPRSRRRLKRAARIDRTLARRRIRDHVSLNSVFATDGAQMNTDEMQILSFICENLCPICGKYSLPCSRICN